MGQEINDTGTNKEDIVQMYEQRMRARVRQAGNRMDKKGEVLGQEWHAWAVRMHKRNEEEIRGNACSCGGQHLMGVRRTGSI